MALEKIFIECNIFNTYNMSVCQFNDLINHDEGKTVRQRFLYLLLSIYWFLVGIIDRNIPGVFIFFDILLDLFCKLYIAAVAGTVCNNMRFDGIPDQGQVTDHIQ